MEAFPGQKQVLAFPAVPLPSVLPVTKEAYHQHVVSERTQPDGLLLSPVKNVLSNSLPIFTALSGNKALS